MSGRFFDLHYTIIHGGIVGGIIGVSLCRAIKILIGNIKVTSRLRSSKNLLLTKVTINLWFKIFLSSNKYHLNLLYATSDQAACSVFKKKINKKKVKYS